ncbi:hypothetical protein CYLTODRAFT_416401, partial [Cylindrobasidium torrendii FP15055 ss-10]
MNGDEPEWKQTKLSLERPYKDEEGNPIRTVYDVTDQGYFYERKQTAPEKLRDNIKRIPAERGWDIFDKTKHGHLVDTLPGAKTDVKKTDEKVDDEQKDMTSGELREMLSEMGGALMWVKQELTDAVELLNEVVPSSGPNINPSLGHLQSLVSGGVQAAPQEQKPNLLSGTMVKKQPPSISTQAFDAQLVLGAKDESLRKATDIFKTAADKMEASRMKSEKYWADALKIRKANWPLVPAPLPPGAATGKGADKLSRDFMITYGLEESSHAFRRRAIAWMGSTTTVAGFTPDDIVFPHRQHHSLRISIVSSNGETAYSSPPHTDHNSLQGMLKSAQREMVEQEIFTYLVNEASSLPTASAKVSERFISIEAALGIELRFELFDADIVLPPSNSKTLEATCDLIYHSLQALLLQRHEYTKQRRLAHPSVAKAPADPPLVLQPVLDILQYHVFCERTKSAIDSIVHALTAAGIYCSTRYQPVGQVGDTLVKLLDDRKVTSVNGQCVLRIDRRHTIRFSFASPSTLTAHLSQVTLTIASIPQLDQLITDDVSRFLLTRICELGRSITEDTVGGLWFLDLDRCIGKWEGCVFNFRLHFEEDGSAVKCVAFLLNRHTPKDGEIYTYAHEEQKRPLLEWAEEKIRASVQQAAPAMDTAVS